MTRDPLRIRVSGPLGPFVPGFIAELVGQGYARASVVHQVELAAHVSRWMVAEGIAPAELTGEHVARFVASRRVAGYRHFLTARSLAPLLGYLRGLGVTPVPTTWSSGGPADALLER